ncbi:hypothetical protein EYF80_058181 [Liparis tanakae]|uniref:Uncharacterized protein n=1 Tax=Liparis tanakae TaxID=230148 RepID=A0A4Z2ESU6_9TELE|nr:hypothetical protein EYF80_058181 [Liparis tanakae]
MIHAHAHAEVAALAAGRCTRTQRDTTHLHRRDNAASRWRPIWLQRPSSRNPRRQYHFPLGRASAVQNATHGSG